MSAALLDVSHVSKTFTRGGLFSRRRIAAVDDVSFRIEAARPEIFTIVGESGSGKTTLSRMILNIERPTSGALVFDGLDLRRCEAAPAAWPSCTRCSRSSRIRSRPSTRSSSSTAICS